MLGHHAHGKTPDACVACPHGATQGASRLGILVHNIGNTRGKARPVHSVLLAAGIPIVEHLTGLAALPTHGFRFSAVPPKIVGMGTFPVRAHAHLDGEPGDAD